MQVFPVLVVAQDEYCCGKICPFLYTQQDECGITHYRCHLFGSLSGYVDDNVSRCYECRDMERRSKENGN
jgi:hypothetical protein